MPTFQWTASNGGIYSYAQFHTHLLTNVSTQGGVSVLTFDYAYGAFPKSADALVLVVDDYEDLGGGHMSGTVQSFQAIKNGEVVIYSNDLNLDLSVATADGQLLWNDFTNGGVTLIGSNGSDNDLNGFTDDFMTGTGDDLVKAKGGYDYIEGNIGNDTIYGGDGFDILSYQWVYDTTGGIIANLENNSVKSVNGEMQDFVRGIEEVRGTMGDDVFKGVKGDKDESFLGYAGDDFFNGRGGDEDQIRYDKDFGYGGDQGLVVNLKGGWITDPFGDTDTVKNIEIIHGTQYRDKYYDDPKADNGYIGGNGNDRFVFKGGQDWANGGAGADTFVIKGKSEGVSIVDFSPWEGDRVKMVGANSMSDLTIFSEGGSTIVEFDGHSVELVNTGSVSADMFIF